MTAPAKFLFDTDFGTARKPAGTDVPTLPVADHLAEMTRVDEAAYLRGVADGRQQAESDETARLASSMQRLALNFADAAAQFADIAGRAEQHAAELAVMMARKLSAGVALRHPVAEIEAVARSVFGHLRATPHVVVRVNDALVEAVKPRLDALARESGFTGTVVILGEPEIMPGDARVEWADGGVARDRAVLERVLDDVVRRYLAAATRREETKP